MHQYLDSDSSGTHKECHRNVSDALIEATQWLIDNKYRGFLCWIWLVDRSNLCKWKCRVYRLSLNEFECLVRMDMVVWWIMVSMDLYVYARSSRFHSTIYWKTSNGFIIGTFITLFFQISTLSFLYFRSLIAFPSKKFFSSAFVFSGEKTIKSTVVDFTMGANCFLLLIILCLIAREVVESVFVSKVWFDRCLWIENWFSDGRRHLLQKWTLWLIRGYDFWIVVRYIHW